MPEEWDERIHDAEDLYRDADLSWGGNAQMAKAAEEFSELAAVCARDLNGQADRENFLGELIDARLMIEQLAQHITDEALRTTTDEKVEQLEDRLREHGRLSTATGSDGGDAR